MTLSVATITTVVSAALCTLSGNSLVEGLNNSSMEAPRHLTTVDSKFTHTLVGYWHDFDNPSGKSYPLSHISKDWDVIIVAFATNEGNGNVGFELDPAAGSEDQFIANIKSLQAAGKTIALSLGGQDGSVTLNDATETTNFVNSVYGLITKYGFNGIDLDLENGISQGLPIINNLISAVKQLRQKVGPSFYLSMAPEHPYVQGGYVSFGGTWGAYLPIIGGLRDELTQVHVQYYNNGGFTYTDGRIVNEGTVDCLVGGSVMLIEGFRTNYGTGWEFKGLRPDQVSFGVPSGPSSAMRGQATPEVVRRALTCLVQGVGCDRIKPPSLYSTFRGIMAWSIHWDSHDGFVFSRSARSVLDKLPVVHYESSRRVHITARPTTPSPERATSPAAPQATSKLCGDNHHICYWPFLKRALPFSKADCAKFPSDVFVWCP